MSTLVENFSLEELTNTDEESFNAIRDFNHEVVLENFDKLNKLTTALEGLYILSTGVESKEHVSLEYAKVQLDQIFNSIGLEDSEAMSMESLLISDENIARENILTSIKNGTARILNLIAKINELADNLFGSGLRLVTGMGYRLDKQIEQAKANIINLPKRNAGIVDLSIKSAKQLSTKNGNTATFNDIKTLLSNHVNFTEKITKSRTLINMLESGKLDEFRKIMTAISKEQDTKKLKIEVNSEKKKLIKEVESLFHEFKNFDGRALFNGKTLEFSFDEEAAERFVFYKDFYDISVKNNPNYLPPKDIKGLTQDEAKELLSYVISLRETIWKFLDQGHYVTNIRRNLVKADAVLLVFPGLLHAAMYTPIGPLIGIGLAFAAYVFAYVYFNYVFFSSCSALAFSGSMAVCDLIKKSTV